MSILSEFLSIVIYEALVMFSWLEQVLVMVVNILKRDILILNEYISTLKFMWFMVSDQWSGQKNCFILLLVYRKVS